ncbi:MAG: hypothetical protein RLZZ242_1080 [Bacteroidota bacterium]|jgi:ATP-dependent Clp protease adaptor protein ClpS
MRFSREQFEEAEELLTETAEVIERQIILFNDDVNTFDHVIETLIRVCEHTEEQAHQCSLIVHYKGKCSVKNGPYDELKPRCSALLDAGLNAEIQ